MLISDLGDQAQESNLEFLLIHQRRAVGYPYPWISATDFNTMCTVPAEGIKKASELERASHN